MPDVTMVENSRLPSLRVVLHDSNGPYNLVFASAVTFGMMSSGGVNKVNSGACTIESAAEGLVRYDWATGDVDTPGIFLGRFRVTLSGKTLPFPSDRFLIVEIQESTL